MTEIKRGNQISFMKYRYVFKAIVVASLIGKLLVPDSSMAWTDENAGAKPLALRKIMRDMGVNMQVITDGISREDWQLIEKTAQLIADHPQPHLSEKMSILRFVGSQAGQFKSYDGETHHVAQELRQAATLQDGLRTISSFAALQKSCFACHQKFRKPFVEHFYE